MMIDSSWDNIPNIAEQLGYDLAFGNDGAFYMSYEDFCRIFTGVGICPHDMGRKKRSKLSEKPKLPGSTRLLSSYAPPQLGGRGGGGVSAMLLSTSIGLGSASVGQPATAYTAYTAAPVQPSRGVSPMPSLMLNSAAMSP